MHDGAATSNRLDNSYHCLVVDEVAAMAEQSHGTEQASTGPTVDGHILRGQPRQQPVESLAASVY